MRRKDPFLEIQPNENHVLPEKYLRVNDICAIIYDQITEIYHLDVYKDLFTNTINFRNPKFDKYDLNKYDGHILNWLEKENYDSDLRVTLIKHIFLGLLSEFIQFVFESLYTAKRGKMSVAFSLARKPFSDLLLLFEQINIKPIEFIDNFYFDGNPQNYDPSKIKNKTSIIEKSVNSLRIRNLISSEVIHDIRYKKDYQFSLNSFSNHALHIVTNDRHYRTTEQNFNFIFSNDKDMSKYFYYFYNTIPYLLVYSVSVFENVLFNFLETEESKYLKIVKEFRRTIALLILLDLTKKGGKVIISKFFDFIYDSILLQCDSCYFETRLRRNECEYFLDTEEILCSSCNKNLLSNLSNIDIIDRSLDILSVT